MHKSGYLVEHHRRDVLFTERTASDFASNAISSGKLNSDFIRLIIQGWERGRDASITGITQAGLKIASITDDTRVHQRNIDGNMMQRPKQRRWSKGWSSRIGKRD